MVGRKRNLKRYYVPLPWEPYTSGEDNDSPEETNPTQNKVPRAVVPERLFEPEDTSLSAKVNFKK